MRTASFDGLLVVDKPQGITSRDAVDRVQRWFPRGTKIGHTGTLDPLATGVLVICVGSATRLTEYVQRMAKTYTSTFHLGAVSESDDADGIITERAVERPPTHKEIEICVRGLLGEIDQVPPAFSAAKVTGRRAYKLARAGEEVQLAPRRVRIDSIEILAFQYPLLELKVDCGKGTYIRSLARDIGAKLGCGGYVEVLRRTRVGPFRAEVGLGLDAVAAEAQSKLLPVSAAVSELPRVTVPEWGAGRLRQGRGVPLRDCSGVLEDGPELAGFAEDGTLIGIVRVDGRTGEVLPSKVIVSG